MEGCLGRTGRGHKEGMLLPVSDCLECTELCLGTKEEPTERLWAGMKGRAGTGYLILEVCYGFPIQED